jgi:hypothetical protein
MVKTIFILEYQTFKLVYIPSDLLLKCMYPYICKAFTGLKQKLVFCCPWPTLQRKIMKIETHASEFDWVSTIIIRSSSSEAMAGAYHIVGLPNCREGALMGSSWSSSAAQLCVVLDKPPPARQGNKQKRKRTDQNVG